MKKLTEKQKLLATNYIPFVLKKAKTYYIQTFDSKDEIISTAFFALVEASGKYNEKYKLPIATFISFYVENRLADYFKIKKRILNFNEFFDPVEQTALQLKELELRKSIIEDIKFLQKDEKRVIFLYYYENMNQRQIAKELKLSRSWVIKLHKTAINKLKTRCY